MSADRQRRPGAAVDTELMGKTLPNRLLDKWGWFGVSLWVLVILAAKRSLNEGTISYASPQDALAQMGVPPDAIPEDFDLEEFWKVTGHHKETRKTVRNRLTHITITRFPDWQREGD